MGEHFDVFQRRANGSPNWIASVATLEEAKEIVSRLANSNGHFDYFVYDFKIGKNVWVSSVKAGKAGAQS